MNVNEKLEFENIKNSLLRRAYQRSLPEGIRKKIRENFLNPIGINKSKLEKEKLKPSSVVEAKKFLVAWQLEDALNELERIISVESDHKRALQLYATVLGHLGRRSDSLAAAQSILKVCPIDVPARRHIKALGYEVPNACREVAYKCAQESSYEPSVLLDCAAYLYEAEMFEESIEFCELGLLSSAISKRKAKYLWLPIRRLKLQLGMSFEASNDFEKAIDIYRELLPELHVGRAAAAGLARCYLEDNKPERAESLLNISNYTEKDSKKFSPLLLDALQAQGKLRESYLLYRLRPVSEIIKNEISKLDKDDVNILDRKNISRKALIIMEGGPGDELRFSTMYQDISNKFAHVTVTCDPRLTSVLKRSFTSIDFLPVARLRREFIADTSDRRSIKNAQLLHSVSDKVLEISRKHDVTYSILDTLADIRPNLDAFKGARIALQPRTDLKQYWVSKIEKKGKVKIGLSWRSILQTVARNRHYLAVEQLIKLKTLVGCEFWILQPKVSQEELTFLEKHLSIKVPDELDLVDDFEGQVALISCLDYVISPFTTMGELSGACGIPTVLISTSGNTAWRRQLNGRDIWHPSATVITSLGPHSKERSVEKVVEFLEGEIKEKNIS